MNNDFSGNIERFTGFADQYDKYRPSPPSALADLLMRLTGTPRAALVVDLGSGTGLSSRYWADKAEQVIGVEPTLDMRKQAELRPTRRMLSIRKVSHIKQACPATAPKSSPVPNPCTGWSRNPHLSKPCVSSRPAESLPRTITIGHPPRATGKPTRPMRNA